MAKKIVLGADHGGFMIKNELFKRLVNGYGVFDAGAYTYEPDDDYPDIARKVALRVISGEADRGILVCGSGVGACIAANKIAGSRASTCHDTYSAHQGVEHDNMNILCLGARVIGIELAYELVIVFLNAKFNSEERYLRRVTKISKMELQGLKGTNTGESE